MLFCIGELQLEAAIAAAHAQAKTYADTNWQDITALYARLSETYPSPIITLNHAAAIFQTGDIKNALATLTPLKQTLKNYQYYHGLLAEIHLKTNNPKQAKSSFEAALKLANSPAAAIHIREKIDQIKNNS